MKKNKKLIVVFILIIALLSVMVTSTKATDDVDELPVIGTDPNDTTDEPANNEEVPSNNETDNDTSLNIPENTTNTNTGNNETLPQTGVASDTALFIFIGICIISAVYAYFKIKKYNNIH